MKLHERITEAQRRISAGLSPMRIPADQCDPDIVLADCAARLDRLEALRDEVRKVEASCRYADESRPMGIPWARIVALAEAVDGGET